MGSTDAPELHWRRAPRIISRSRLRPGSNLNKKSENVAAKNDTEMDDEVGEGFVVRGGVMMRIADVTKEKWKPVKRFYIDVNRSQIYQDARIRDTPSSDDEQNSSAVTVDVSALPGDGRMLHLSDNLPGVANDVESYPCRYCPNRIFLTSFGLEKHTETEHKEHLTEVMEEISRIRNEWRRRETFRSIAKKRREALKKTRMLTEVVRRTQDVLPGEANRAIDRRYTGVTNCHICGLSFEANSEALMNHVRAHRKNDDLRRRLLANFGPDYVARCTCHQCHLVFINEKNLMIHREWTHVRKRKYVCKWCGDVCQSVNELNEHKKDVHGVPYIRSEKLPIDSPSTSSQKSPTQPDTTDVAVDEPLPQSNKPKSGSSVGSAPDKHLTSVLNRNPCMTKCSECGLTTVKPSLLIRHMQRVHNKNSFSTEIVVKGMPNIRVDMDRGKVTWWCCNFSFEDRHRFLYHRKTCHQPFLEDNGYLQNSPVENSPQFVAVEGTDGAIIGQGQIVQLVNPDGTQSEDLYVLVSEDNDPVQNDEDALREVEVDEPITDGAQEITLTVEEYMQLRQQFGENFVGNMQFVLVDDDNDVQQQSPPNNAVLAPAAVDFIQNNMVDNDILNSSLISSSQMSSTNEKFYTDTHVTDPEFSVSNVPDAMEDVASPGDLPESLLNPETGSSSVPIPAVTFSHENLVNGSLSHHFQLQSNALDGITTIPTVPVLNGSTQQLHYSIAPATVPPELAGITVTPTPGVCPSLVMMRNNITLPPSSNHGYCIMEDHKPAAFLEKQQENSTAVLDSIPNLMDLERKDNTITTTTATTTIVGSLASMEQQPSTGTTIDGHINPFYVSQDMNTTTVASRFERILYSL